jgi:hypothetical protein
MKSTLRVVGVWFRDVYEALKSAEDAMDYRYEDYAEMRFKKLEQRIFVLENATRK